MNRSWNSNPNNSSGFVYFNNSYQNDQSDTSDFLSFDDGPSYSSPNPKFNRFSPSNYSSPQKFNNSPRQYNNRNNFRYSSGYHNRSYNSNNSFNSSYNNNTRRRENGPHNKKKNNGNGKTDMSIFFDHSSVKDPWAELEENLRKKRVADTLQNKGTSVGDNAETSSGSDGEQETESETKSNSSGVDEEAT